MSTGDVKLSPLFPYEPLTQEQLRLMEEFAAAVEKLSEVSSTFYETFTNQRDVFLVKFLTARKWVVADALKMLVDTTEFRKTRGLDVNPLFPACIQCHGYDQKALEDFHKRGTRPTSELDRYSNQLRSCYFSSWHKWDKEGRPVYIERTGKMNVKEIVRRCKQMVPPGGDFHEPCTTCHLHANEVGGVLLKFVNSNRNADTPPISQVTVVMDCTGFTLGHLFGPAMDILKVQSALDQAYYPEGLHRLYVANAPTALSVGWNIVKGWLDPRVQKKIVIMKPGNDTRNGLFSAIDPESIPQFLGGTCNCVGGCVGMENPEDFEEDDELFADNVVKTDVLRVAARDKLEKTISVEANTQTAWDFSTEDKLDINFSATFADKDGKTTVVAPAQRQRSGNGQCVNTEPGTITFLFDNTYSWVSKKTVCFLASTTPLDS